MKGTLSVKGMCCSPVLFHHLWIAAHAHNEMEKRRLQVTYLVHELHQVGSIMEQDWGNRKQLCERQKGKEIYNTVKVIQVSIEKEVSSLPESQWMHLNKDHGVMKCVQENTEPWWIQSMQTWEEHAKLSKCTLFVSHKLLKALFAKRLHSF